MKDWNNAVYSIGIVCAIGTAIWWFFSKDFLEWVWPALTAFYMWRVRNYENWN
jgi:hypothetical protein